MTAALQTLRCGVCGLWIGEFPMREGRRLRSTTRGDLLCVDCILWLGRVLGQDENAMCEEMGIPIHPTREIG